MLDALRFMLPLDDRHVLAMRLEPGRVSITPAELRFRAVRIAQIHNAFSENLNANEITQKRWILHLREAFNPERNFYIHAFKGRPTMDLAVSIKIIIEDWGIALESWGNINGTADAGASPIAVVTLNSVLENLIESEDMINEYLPEAERATDVSALSGRLNKISPASMGVPKPGDSYVPISCFRKTLGLV